MLRRKIYDVGVLRRREEKSKYEKNINACTSCVLAFSLAGCGGSKDSSTAGSGDLSGKISLDGSTSMEKFVTALGESFKEKNPNVTVESQFTGSSAGIASVLSGKADLAFKSIN